MKPQSRTMQPMQASLLRTRLTRMPRHFRLLRHLLLSIVICLLFSSIVTGTVIKAGMTLNIVVKNDKDLSQTIRVNDNGTIDYPLYQDASVIGKTTSELQDILTFKLAKVVESPMVLVSVLTE